MSSMSSEMCSSIHSSFTHCKTITAQPSHINCRRYGSKRQAVLPTMHLHSDIGKQVNPKAKMDGNFSDHVDPAPSNITMFTIKEN